MKIIRAKAAGFCMGVRRAMNMVLEEARNNKSPVMTHGPLIHNPQVIDVLEEKGIRALDPKQELEPGDGTVIVRAHGVAPTEKERLATCGYDIVDATCPHVIRIHKLTSRHVARGDAVIIIGDKGHAEVDGILGHADGKGYAVSTEEDVAALPDLDRVCVVSQTTQSQERFERLVRLIQQRWPDCEVHCTICNATGERQSETVEIAREADVMVVVGGRNSANTVRLAELARETGTPTVHIETPGELTLEALGDAQTIGLTAGASTPNWMIADASERIEQLARQRWHPLKRFLFGVAHLFINTHLYAALGAFFTAYGCSLMEGVPFRPLAAFTAALYILGMYSLNARVEHQIKDLIHRMSLRWREGWGRLMTLLATLGLGSAFACSLFLGFWAFMLIALAIAAGLLYSLVVIPQRFLPVVHYRRLIDIPGSKDILMGVAWALVITWLPWLSTAAGDNAIPIAQLGVNELIAFLVTSFFVFALVFIRSVIFDFRDIQSDEIVGRETIPILLGKNATKAVLGVLTGVLLAAMLAATAMGALTSLGYYMVIAVAYTWTYLFLFHQRIITRGLAFDAIVGGQFILVGVIGALWRLLS